MERVEMSLDEFLKQLRRTSEVVNWGFGPNGQIRGRGPYCCPITAVCELVTGTTFKVRDFVSAADKLNLSPDLALLLSRAADVSSRQLQGLEADLRAEILKAVRLK